MEKETKLTREAFKEQIKVLALKLKADSKNTLRLGQSVFNVCQSIYGDLARIVQFEDNVDCFYLDSEIDKFLDKAYDRYSEEQ